MRTGPVLFALGVGWLQWQARLPPLVPLALAVGALLACALTLHALTYPRSARCVGAGVWLLVGVLWATACATVRLADALPADWEGRDIEIVGVVATLPQRLERGTRFEFEVERTRTAGAYVPRRILLSWWARPGFDRPEPRAGERWRYTVRLKRPHGMVNPHGYDFEAYLLERGVRATGVVRPRGAERLTAFVPAPAYAIEALRGALRDRILAALAERPYAGIAVALAVGDQRAIPVDQWQTFTRTGVNHLMSISGLHITMLAGLAAALVGALWRRHPRWPLRLPTVKAAILGGLLAAMLYTAVAGYAVPAQRTLYMLAVIAFTLLVGIGTSALRVLGVAVFVVVLLDPWAVLAAGFWLSFGAVAIILHATLHRIGRNHWFVAWARVQLAVTLGLLPVLLILFQQVSLVSPLANAFAIPVVSLVVVPLVLAGMVLPFDAVLQFAHGVLAVCMSALDALARLPAPVWEQHAPPLWAALLALLGAVWLALPRGMPARALGVILLLPLLFARPEPPAAGAARITVLDVGQGLAVVAQTRTHALVYDAGPAYGPGADAGSRIVVPYLRARGIRRLDAMLLTHDDADHTGGALSVLQALPVRDLLTSLPDGDPLLFHAEREAHCRAGQSWLWDGVRFDVLHPPQASDAAGKDNDRSCVLRIAAGERAVLLPADLEARGEAALLSSSPALSADVLIAPHQGSRTSSTPDFVAAVAPRAVVFPAGYRNRYGHPHADVVERYRAVAQRLLRTDRDGAVTIDLAPSGVQLQAERAVYRRYWLAPPVAEARTLDLGADDDMH